MFSLQEDILSALLISIEDTDVSNTKAIWNSLVMASEPVEVSMGMGRVNHHSRQHRTSCQMFVTINFSGIATERTSANKIFKYDDLVNTHMIVPIAIETSGALLNLSTTSVEEYMQSPMIHRQCSCIQ